uniref:Plastid lipid-associated protein/fibrillin conserved domain-containing protein n=1 Tax=Eucampia antarctica TaxID=49252 RepID=A0A7S2RA73_9STRA|mmetsp:Transcript_19393/g.18637  ORF Transcript_19393/g.18637 Transcript_19393/m.18637 type:complete len:482 (+) Transcript_19393:128-1573(+)
MKFCIKAVAIVTIINVGHAFVPNSVPFSISRRAVPALLKVQHTSSYGKKKFLFSSAGQNDEAADEEEEAKPVNPYQDPNYPDLEFVNYDDPEYAVDQGVSDGEYYDPLAARMIEKEATEEAIEEMREERRRKNDEFQFETYFASVLRNGEEFKGEWEVFKSSTFLPGFADKEEENGPQLMKGRKIIRTVSGGKKVKVPTDSDFRVDGERIVHTERVATAEDYDDDFEDTEEVSEQHANAVEEILSNHYWPEEMSSYEFRGPAGTMCVGNAYTICDSIPLSNAENNDGSHDGPFSEMRAELGIQYKRMRFRVKLDYRVKGYGHEEKQQNGGKGMNDKEYPLLQLYSLVVCRETVERWPRYENKNVDDSGTAALFCPPGANGGLYDPPPVGSDEQSMQYTMLDLEGGATLLFPHKIDQDPVSHDGNGWVTSLDWTPGRIRFQADRKISSGVGLKGLRTLELTEVEASNADTWRPKDGGQNMIQ